MFHSIIFNLPFNTKLYKKYYKSLKEATDNLGLGLFLINFGIVISLLFLCSTFLFLLLLNISFFVSFNSLFSFFTTEELL